VKPPFVDEHAIEISAPPEAVWGALLGEVYSSPPGAEAFAAALGCRERRRSGERGAAGSNVIGFRVTGAAPGTELALEGEHRFSSYALTFAIDETAAGRVRLRALTHAAFPGRAGGAYRRLVIGSGAHRVLLRRLLSRVRDAAEA
jgi:hypothetical protein